MRASEE
jgi:hypothetical protein